MSQCWDLLKDKKEEADALGDRIGAPAKQINNTEIQDFNIITFEENTKSR